MTVALIVVAAFVVIGGGTYVWARLPPRQALAVLIAIAGVGLLVLRQVVFAVPMFLMALRYWRQGARMTPSAGGRSEVESRALHMTLDHATGDIDGKVITGAFAGRRLSDLSDADLAVLMQEIKAAGDDDSLALLLAWMERAGRSVEPPAANPPSSGGPMTPSEAYRVLGLAPGASLEDVRAAYRRLMKRVHPDLGGTDGLAAMINAAKDVLDPG